MQRLKHRWQQAHVDELLRLLVRACRQIADSANNWDLDRERLVVDKLNKSRQ